MPLKPKAELSKTTIVLMLLLCSCTASPAPVTPHVSYDMSGTLDGKPLPQLETIKADSCYDGYGGYKLTFSAIADMIPEAIDDEINLGLTVDVSDISQLPLGQSVDVAQISSVQLSATATGFLFLPQGALTITTGTITLSALSHSEMSGSASLVFTDQNDVNPMVQEALAYEIAFNNLAITYYCENT
jgi:hypothetical protein